MPAWDLARRRTRARISATGGGLTPRAQPEATVSFCHRLVLLGDCPDGALLATCSSADTCMCCIHSCRP